MEQIPQYFWHEPTTSWKTQEELDQILLEEQQEIERLQQEELQREQEELRKRQEEEQKEFQRQYEENHKKFVLINKDGLIERITVASKKFIDMQIADDEIYIENTNQIKNEPIPGGTYSEELNAFLPPKPYESWILNEETWQWDPPEPLSPINEPGPGKGYSIQYNAYILPPPDDTWILNTETLEWEPPIT